MAPTARPTPPRLVPASTPENKTRPQGTWAASREGIKNEDKRILAHYFAHHDFLVEPGASPAAAREVSATAFVNQGTSPKEVVHECLKWISEHSEEVAFHVAWYTTSALVPATLYDFRYLHPHLRDSTQVHLFPGEVDLQLQAQLSDEAVHYAETIERQFDYMILSGYSFDLRTGEVKFNFDREIAIQRTCALLKAHEKFLFFDSAKFKGNGRAGYSVHDLLETCNTVVIYTVRPTEDNSDERIEQVKAGINRLADNLLFDTDSDEPSNERKTIRLTIVGRDNKPSETIARNGFLRTAKNVIESTPHSHDEAAQ